VGEVPVDAAGKQRGRGGKISADQARPMRQMRTLPLGAAMHKHTGRATARRSHDKELKASQRARHLPGLRVPDRSRAHHLAHVARAPAPRLKPRTPPLPCAACRRTGVPAGLFSRGNAPGWRTRPWRTAHFRCKGPVLLRWWILQRCSPRGRRCRSWRAGQMRGMPGRRRRRSRWW
jgi:hypothetical protein